MASEGGRTEPTGDPDGLVLRHAVSPLGPLKRQARPTPVIEVPARLDRIGSYLVARRIAEGGMGTVYEAFHPLLKRRVAIKVLRPEMIGISNARDGLLREANILESLAHPSMPRLYDAGVLEDGRPWIAMELVTGECLFELLARRGRLPIGEVTQLLSAIAEVLSIAHQRGLIHFDLKPENIMIHATPTGVEARIIDWGIAELVSTQGPHQTIAGTPHYMAPEQIRGEPGNPRIDVYALGVVAFELLSGHTPFVGDTPRAIALQHLNSPVPPLGAVGETLPPALEALVRRMLSKAPADRPTLDEVRAALDGPGTPSDLLVRPIELAGARPRAGAGDSDLVRVYPSVGPNALADRAVQLEVPLRWTPALPLAARNTHRFLRESSRSERIITAVIQNH